MRTIPWKISLKVRDSEKAWTYKVGTPVGTYRVTPVRVGLRYKMYKLQVACGKLPVQLQVACGKCHTLRYIFQQPTFKGTKPIKSILVT